MQIYSSHKSNTQRDGLSALQCWCGPPCVIWVITYGWVQILYTGIWSWHILASEQPLPEQSATASLPSFRHNAKHAPRPSPPFKLGKLPTGACPLAVASVVTKWLSSKHVCQCYADWSVAVRNNPVTQSKNTHTQTTICLDRVCKKKYSSKY